MHQLIRRIAAALVAAACIINIPSSPRAQAVPAIDKRITYILPLWGPFPGLEAGQISEQVAELRQRLGPEGPGVKLGFTVYVDLRMVPVDPSDTAAVRAGLAYTFEQVDAAIARAVAANIPICLSFVTSIRQRVDPLQERAQMDDRRNMQWHADQSLATGWVTFSRYARKQERVEEAFIRELGRGLAARMLQYPNTIVAASGDGEVELSYEKSSFTSAAPPLQIADYSPFAIAEFRDWLRGTGLYAAGQPFAGQAYVNSARYAADASFATLNSDFNLTFGTWNLKHFDWSLADDPNADPRALPAGVYADNGTNAFPSEIPNGFDAPRMDQRGTPWFDLWDQFRQTMVWRHNLEFAKWITTSADPATGATVPADRWFTDQIPADYLFGFTPQNPDLRLITSGSPHWTADVSPYGSMGITSFNGYHPETGGFFKTLAGVAPLIAQRKVRWGIFEWAPSVPAHPDVNVYRDEMALVERYRPSVLVPFYWKNAEYPIEGTGFEVALKELIARIRIIPLALSRTSLVVGATTTGDGVTPPQTVRVSGVPGETPPWTVTAASPFLDVARAPDGRSFTVAPKAGQPYAPGTQGAFVTISSSDPGYSPVTLNVTLNVTAPGASSAPVGAFDTPADLQIVTGELGITGWAVDDMGVKSVDIYRSPVAEEPQGALVYLGTASLVEGARPDVLAQFPNSPLADNAGWGYMLLSNFLPYGGTGVFTLHALVTDVDGHTTHLGSRRIDARNRSAITPFGTIDTPAQGATVSGTIVNFGWVLTPNPNVCIPIDGSTIAVVIDNVVVGRPVYNNPRSDIATLFPGLCNSNAAVGYFTIDTTTLTNGVHTIAWVARDDAGQAVGLGSRYFTVANP